MIASGKLLKGDLLVFQNRMPDPRYADVVILEKGSGANLGGGRSDPSDFQVD